MNTLGAYEKCRRYIESHSQQTSHSEKIRSKFGSYPCITISRETGAGADIISEQLADYFQSRTTENIIQWAVFNKNLIKKVLQDHNLPSLVSNYLVEDKYSNVSSAIHEILGLQPSNWTLVQHTTETILQLARMGNVIIVGRGANIITANLQNAFHIRLVAPIENRINHVMHMYELMRKEAIEFIKREDAARKNYLLSNFYKNVDDPIHYHLILNTALFGFEETTNLIGDAVRRKFAGIFTESKLKYSL